MAKSWEYMEVSDLNPMAENFVEELDSYGGQGWELVSIIPTGYVSPSHICVFKTESESDPALQNTLDNLEEFDDQ